MTTEQREPISGYRWINLPEINALVPMPEQWFSLGIIIPKPEDPNIIVMASHLYQLSRESLKIKEFFSTGFALYAFTEYSKCFPERPVDFARGVLQTLPYIQPIEDVKETEDDSFVICRRRFILPQSKWITSPNYHGEMVTRQLPPTHFYYLSAGNKQTDTAYLAWFETPSSKWKDDKPIAQTMIDGLTLDENV